MIDRIQTSMLPTIQVVHSSNEPSQTSLLKCFNPIKNSELLVSHHRSKNRSINSKRAAHELHVFQQIPELFLAPRANHHPPNYLHSTPRSISKKKNPSWNSSSHCQIWGHRTNALLASPGSTKIFLVGAANRWFVFFCRWLILWQPGWSGGYNQNNWNHQLVVAGHFQFRDIAGLGNCPKKRWPTNTTHLNSYVKGTREKKNEHKGRFESSPSKHFWTFVC